MEEKVRIQTCTKTMLKIDFSLHLGFDSQDGEEPPIPRSWPIHLRFPWEYKFQWKLYRRTITPVSYIKNRLKNFRFF